MNKELKFRVWSKVKNTWVHNMMLLACIDGLPFAHFVEINEVDKSVKHHVYNASNLDVVIQQYTGLKDSRGKDIYEGDILQCKGFDSWHDPEGYYYNQVVEHKIMPAGESELSGFLYIPIDREVIGNIFENPELLNQ